MAKEKVTIKKNLVCYFAAITQDVKQETAESTEENPVYENVSQTKYYKLETSDEDYSPFIEYDETAWTEIEKESLPDTLYQIKTVKVPFVDEETEEEKTIVYVYYYTLVETEVEVDKYVKGICTACLYCVETNRHWRKRFECSHPDHIREDFVTGMTCNGDCRDFNMQGECHLFTSILEDEDTTDNDTTDDTTNDDTVPSSDDTTADEVINDGGDTSGD